MNIHYKNETYLIRVVEELPEQGSKGYLYSIRKDNLGAYYRWKDNATWEKTEVASGSELTPDELDGIQNANNLNAANPVATMEDLDDIEIPDPQLTPDELAGIQNANGLNAANPAATMADIPSGGGLQLGETDTTAYRGDRGKIAYDHSQEVTGNPHNVNASDVGLGNVDNTSDLDKPISTATQGALDSKASDLDLTNHTSNQSNPHSVTKTQVGLEDVDNTSDLAKPISTATQNALDDKTDNTDFTDHTSDQLNPHNVTKAQVGLSNVDNTSDLDKPVSTAQAAANVVIQNDVDEKVNSKTTNEPTGSDKVINMVSLTQAEYDAGTPNPTTFYIITDA